jgi:anaerobic magnesium-protoporphyrin IX monomethyl ester cyclase
MSNKIIPIKTRTNKDIQETLRNPVDSNMGISLSKLHEEFSSTDMPEDKYLATAKGMLKYAMPAAQKNLSTVKIENVTRRTHIALILMPKWAVFFAPYNIARLAAVTRAAGYRTSVFDWNVDTWHKLKKVLPEDPYEGHGSRDYLWLDDMYETRLQSHVEPILEEYLTKIIELKPDVVGFSLYYTNVFPTLWLAKKIRQHLPDTKIIAGGSHIQWNPDPFPEFDHVVKGEGEELLLQMLDDIENGIPLTEYQYNADKTKRINLDQLPFPDYSDLDVNAYMIPNAISSELSRGCVAKCTFCQETHYWKYRSRQAPFILEEVEHQYRTYGTNVFWFIDSLVNGNINELRAFALGVVERGLKIKWEGYARCDERMDLEYYQDLKASGCMALNYGIESGSQRVLDAMRKNVTIAEVEKNLRDGASVGIEAQTNWMLCYLNEETVDFAKTMTLAWRIQNYRLTSMARGTMNIGPGRIDDDREFYNVHPKYFCLSWATKDLSNTKIHRLIRFKSFNIFVEQMPAYGQWDSDKSGRLKTQYQVNYNNQNVQRVNIKEYLDVPYEEFDYEIIKDPSLDCVFMRTIVNEPWALVRSLWRSRHRQGMEFSVKFDPEWDLNEYGNRLADKFTANYYFKIDDAGHWTANVTAKFDCPENPHAPWFPENDVRSDYNIDLAWSGSGNWN